MTILTKVKLLFALWKKIETPEIQELIYNNRDEVALALGRWIAYKNSHCLDFMIGLNKDNECVLFQVFTPRGTVGALTGVQLIKREFAMELACQDMLDKGIVVDQFLEQHVRRVVPSHDA